MSCYNNNCQKTKWSVNNAARYPAHCGEPEPERTPCKTLHGTDHGHFSVSSHPEDEENYDGLEDYCPETIYSSPEEIVCSPSIAMIIDPCQAPSLEEIRAYGFSDHLVSIEDDIVLSNLCEEPPEIIEDTCLKDIEPFRCKNPESCDSLRSAGSQLENKWCDALPVRAMTLLGRVGKKLAKLKGEGWLYLNDRGEVSASKKIPLTVTKLWHKFFAPSNGSAPFVGPPMDAPYLTVADHDGTVYVVKGLPDQDSVMQWNHVEGIWEQKVLSDLPWCVTEHLTGSTELELIGFTPVPVGGDIATVRCPQRLVGSGMICFEEIPSGLDYECECAPQPTTTTVARFIPNPPDCGDEPYIMAFQNGKPTWVDPSTIESLRGPAGENGDIGPVGPVGPAGPQGATGATNHSNVCCDPCGPE